ncbi:MAG: hypothetical protein K0V04_10280 [Deltaproteobacteria bacterium]|nr:hypothetical protein [Deltaproteobacteria bacterium]
MQFLLFASVLLGMALTAWKAQRFRQRLALPAPKDVCIACASPDLESLGPDLYRCRQCEYEGGDGMRAREDARAAAAYAGVDPLERQRLSHRRLHEALQTLSSARASIPSDYDELARWHGSLCETALRAASELDDAVRAAGGRIVLPGDTDLDAERMAAMLRTSTPEEINPYGATGSADGKRMLRLLADARRQLEHGLRDVPQPNPGHRPSHGYRG